MIIQVSKAQITNNTKNAKSAKRCLEDEVKEIILHDAMAVLPEAIHYQKITNDIGTDHKQQTCTATVVLLDFPEFTKLDKIRACYASGIQYLREEHAALRSCLTAGLDLDASGITTIEKQIADIETMLARFGSTVVDEGAQAQTESEEAPVCEDVWEEEAPVYEDVWEEKDDDA